MIGGDNSIANKEEGKKLILLKRVVYKGTENLVILKRALGGV